MSSLPRALWFRLVCQDFQTQLPAYLPALQSGYASGSPEGPFVSQSPTMCLRIS